MGRQQGCNIPNLGNKYQSYLGGSDHESKSMFLSPTLKILPILMTARGTIIFHKNTETA